MQRRLSSLESERRGMEIKLDERQAVMSTLQKELSDLKAKKDRLTKQVRCYFTDKILRCSVHALC